MSQIKFESALLMKLNSETLKKINSIEIPKEPNGEILLRLPENKLHVTLTSIRSCKDIKDILSTKLPSELNCPEPIIGDCSFVYRTDLKKVSYVAFIENQSEFKSFVDMIYNHMGLENPEPNRYYHITLANNVPSKTNPEQADPFGSIGDVKQSDIQNLNESAENGFQVWFDMDGVLADFDGELQKNEDLQKAKKILHDLISSKFKDYENLKDDQIKSKLKNDIATNPDSSLKELKKVFYNYNNLVYKIAGKPGFFKSLDILPGAIEMLDEAKRITGKLPNILTAPMGDESDPENPSIKEKKEWCEKNLSGKYNIIELTVDKGRVVKSKMDILIDDRQKYIDKFTSAGGTGILHKTPTSLDTQTWKLSMMRLKEICEVKEKKRYIMHFEGFKSSKK